MDGADINELLIELNKVTNDIINLYDKIQSERYRNESIEKLIYKIKDLIKIENEIISNIPGEILQKCLEHLDKILASSSEENEFYNDNSSLISDEYNDYDEDEIIEKENFEFNNNEVEQMDINLIYDDIDVIQRMASKLQIALEIYNEDIIFTDALDYDSSLTNILSAEDVMEGIININVIKRIKEKLENAYIYPSTLSKQLHEDDLLFVKNLKLELICHEIKEIKLSTTMEILALPTNTSISNISNDNLDILLDEIYTNRNESFIYALKLYLISTIDELANKILILNDSFYVFEYLELLTKLEILLTYIDKDTFIIIEEYLNDKVFQNKGIETRVTNMFTRFKTNGYTKRLEP